MISLVIIQLMMSLISKILNEEMLKNDTYSFNGRNIHVGVIKAVHEFLKGDYISVPSHDKCYHIKK